MPISLLKTARENLKPAVPSLALSPQIYSLKALIVAGLSTPIEPVMSSKKKTCGFRSVRTSRKDLLIIIVGPRIVIDLFRIY